MDQVVKDPQLILEIVKDTGGNATAICLLGTEELVNAYTRQKFISLWALNCQKRRLPK